MPGHEAIQESRVCFYDFALFKKQPISHTNFNSLFLVLGFFLMMRIILETCAASLELRF